MTADRTPTLFHVTEREDAAAILAEGFRGSYASLGEGVYFYGTLESAMRFARRRGWDGRLQDPVVLAARAADGQGPRRVTAHDLSATQDPRVYADVWYLFLEEDSDDRYRPRDLWVAVDQPLARRPAVLEAPPAAPEEPNPAVFGPR